MLEFLLWASDRATWAMNGIVVYALVRGDYDGIWQRICAQLACTVVLLACLAHRAATRIPRGDA